MSWNPDKKKDMRIDRHHRRPRSKKGSDGESNVSQVERYRHIAFHYLFKTDDPEQIALTLNQILETMNEVWIDPAYKLIAVKK